MVRSFARHKWSFLIVLGLLAVATAVVAQKGPVFTERDKAFYMDEATINFVRPGLDVKITKAEISADGTAKAWIRVTDLRGLPLDINGITTPGVITVRFLLGYIPEPNAEYTSYITRTRTSGTRTVVQATTDSNGIMTPIAEGEYQYTYGTKLPSNYAKDKTTTVGVTASRDLTEFGYARDVANTTYDFVPNGTPVTVVRDIIRTTSCNKCHDPLNFHGGSRRTMPICILCHTNQTTDATTGNTVDMAVMTHKIHMGESLPSVEAGIPYIIGTRNYSDVVFPSPNEACKVCHEPKEVSGATQADYWKTMPNRSACGSCHDNVNFATGENHAGIPQTNDNSCSRCHPPVGDIDFDTSVTGAHMVPIDSGLIPGLNLTITGTQNVAPGKAAVILFTAKNDKGETVDVSKLDNLRIYMGGPAVDIPSYVREDARSAKLSGSTYAYTMTATIPAAAKGTWQFGMEGYKNVKVYEGTLKEQTIRDYAINPIYWASVDGGAAVPRRTVVANNNCNKCHYQIAFHGGNRNRVEMCTFCHNPNLVEGAQNESWNFVNMIHRFHAEARYPGTLSDCNQCHTGNSQTPPLPPGMLDVKNGLAPINPTPPTTNGCLSCHNTPAAWQHAAAQITPLGESCSVCHGTGKDAAVEKVHAQ